MANYNIRYTDPNLGNIEVAETDINTDFSVNFPGRIRLEWGQFVNENFLNLMENFACPEDLAVTNETIPDHNQSDGKLLNPVKGQLWYNSTREALYSYDGSKWQPYSISGDNYAANWGQVLDGEQLPLPVTSDGYEFTYEECIWSVSPFNFADVSAQMVCYTDLNDSQVTMQYVSKTLNSVISGVANYLIVGIKGNTNLGENISIPPVTTPEPTTTTTTTPEPTTTTTTTPEPTTTTTTTPEPTTTTTTTPEPTTTTTTTPEPTTTTTTTPEPTTTTTTTPEPTTTTTTTPEPSPEPSPEPPPAEPGPPGPPEQQQTVEPDPETLD